MYTFEEVAEELVHVNLPLEDGEQKRKRRSLP